MVEVIKYSGTGRRKKSIARVELTPGTGVIRINKRTFENYFPRETNQILIVDPLKQTNLFGKFDVEAKIVGGGSSGQAGAMRLAIARALVQLEQENKPILKKASLLTRDSRMKERKKPGQKGARKKFQWVKR